MPWTMFISLVVIFAALTYIMFVQTGGYIPGDWLMWGIGIFLGILIEKFCRRKERQWNGFDR